MAAKGEAGSGTYAGLLTFMPNLRAGRIVGVFFLRCGVDGVRGASSTVMGCGVRVDACPYGAGEVDTVHFARHGGLTLIALRVGGANGTDFSVDLKAEHFCLATDIGLVIVDASSRVT